MPYLLSQMQLNWQGTQARQKQRTSARVRQSENTGPLPGAPQLTCTGPAVVPGLCSPWAFSRAAAGGGAVQARGQRARSLAAGKAVPLWQQKAGVRAVAAPRWGGGQMAPWPLLFPVGSPCGSSCQSSSPSELLKLELEPGLGLGLGPAKQAKRKGLPGKIPFREFSRQWSGDSFVAAPWQMTTEHSVHQPDDRPEDRLP